MSSDRRYARLVLAGFCFGLALLPQAQAKAQQKAHPTQRDAATPAKPPLTTQEPETPAAPPATPEDTEVPITQDEIQVAAEAPGTHRRFDLTY